MAQIVIDNVSVLTTPQAMMQAIDDNFDELYADVGGVTDLSETHTSATVTVVSSTGTDAVLPAATTTTAGVMTAAQAAAVVANTAKVSNVSTNLTFSQASTTVTVLSSDGTDAVLPAATTTNAGVMSAAQVTSLNSALLPSYTGTWR